MLISQMIPGVTAVNYSTFKLAVPSHSSLKSNPETKLEEPPSTLDQLKKINKQIKALVKMNHSNIRTVATIL